MLTGPIHPFWLHLVPIVSGWCGATPGRFYKPLWRALPGGFCSLSYFTSFDYPCSIAKIQLQYLTRLLKVCDIEMYYIIARYPNANIRWINDLGPTTVWTSLWLFYLFLILQEYRTYFPPRESCFLLLWETWEIGVGGVFKNKFTSSRKAILSFLR